MSKGIGTKKRKRVLKAREKQNIRKAAKKLAQFVEALPKISEDDLLSFQFTYFGDDSKPEKWFVKPEESLEYQPEYDDGLGYYEDGVKRTLTDEEIAVFRRTEEWHLERAEQKKQQDEEELTQAANAEVYVEEGELNEEPPIPDDPPQRVASPVSSVSSLEPDLMEYAGLTKRTETQATKSSYPRPPSREHSRSATPTSNAGSSKVSRKAKKRRREHQVPYDQRHKRKWEGFIEGEDPVEGSLTHRRLARELDDQKERRVEMDY